MRPGRVEEFAPGVRRLLAGNPSPFTFTGTVSYIVGEGQVAIIDPGPLDEAHLGALLAAVRGETVTHIFVTHTHRDHSPAVPHIKAATGALVLAEGPHRPARALNVGEAPRLDASNDMEFMPDRTLCRRRGRRRRRLDNRGGDDPRSYGEPHGLRVQGGQSVVFGRPCHGLGDAGGRTAGRRHERLHGVAAKAGAPSEPIYLPGHGGAVREAPRFVQHYIRHRQAREASVLHRLAKGEADIPTLVRAIYIGLDPRLEKAAGLSVLAHLEDLVARGLVATDGQPSIEGRYRLG